MYEFFSDNTSPMAPELLAAVVAANEGSLPSYASDRYAAEAADLLGGLFETEVVPFFMSTGTAANALALATLCPPWKRVLCQRNSHIMEAEAGAPEAAGGGLKLSAPHDGALKLDADHVNNEALRYKQRDPHSACFGALSVSQATELGMVYPTRELADVAGAVRANNLSFHMDGARFSNACISLDCKPAEISTALGVHALSYGMAKNGGGLGDAVLLFDLERAEELRFRQMRAGHLVAKNRFLAAQTVAYVKDDLWRRLASRANEAAWQLSRACDAKGWQILAPVEANIVFAALPDTQISRLRDMRYSVNVVSPSKFGLRPASDDAKLVRFVASWNSVGEEVHRLVSALG